MAGRRGALPLSDLLSKDPPPPHVSLSFAAPDKADEIRSAVTGALKHDRASGLWCFEQIVETTFVLPWDLSPLVEPERLSVKLRDGIRGELTDQSMAVLLEGRGALNCHLNVVWQFRDGGTGQWTAYDSLTCQELEKGYSSSVNRTVIETVAGEVEIDFVGQTVRSLVDGTGMAIRRLGCAPLMPMKTEHGDLFSLFHAASLGFWGVNDRTNLLRDAVFYSLDDMRAQFLLCKQWQLAKQRDFPSAGQPDLKEWEEAKQSWVSFPQLHIFTLANVVLRPIIVYAPPDCPVGGIYLPLLWEDDMGRYPCDKHPQLKNPLPLAYNSDTSKFSALTTFRGPKGPSPILLPLCFRDAREFKIHFLSDLQASQSFRVLSHLLNVEWLTALEAGSPQGSPIKSSANLFGTGLFPLFGRRASGAPVDYEQLSTGSPTLVALLNAPELPEVIDSLIKRYQSVFL